jgi:hypothetical protein
MVDDSDGRRRYGNDGRHGEAVALCGVANGGGGRAGMATEGGRGYRGRRWVGAQLWAGGGGRGRAGRRRASAGARAGARGGGRGRARGAGGTAAYVGGGCYFE